MMSIVNSYNIDIVIVTQVLEFVHKLMYVHVFFRTCAYLLFMLYLCKKWNDEGLINIWKSANLNTKSVYICIEYNINLPISWFSKERQALKTVSYVHMYAL